MNDNLVKSSSAFSFHLDGENEIDATLLAKTINDTAQLAKEAAKLVDPEAYLKMNVTAFKNGSFQIDFSTICEVSQTIFTTATLAVGFAGAVVGTMKGFLEVKKLLKGDKPKNVTPVDNEHIKIENTSGDSIVVLKNSGEIIKNQRIDQLTINIANYTYLHNPTGGFTFISETGNVNCGAEDIQNMSSPLPFEEITTCRRSRTRAILPIKKPDMLGRSAWDFRYNNKYINATIQDEDWLERVHNGDIVIKAVVFIDATLEIYEDVNEEGTTIDGSERYTVLLVNGDIINKPKDEQIYGFGQDNR